MRTTTVAERQTVSAAQVWSFAKLEIQDADLVYRDYSQLLAKDFVNGVSLTETIDDNTIRLSGSLLRESGSLSLSPFRSDSLINRNAAGSFATTLDLWRKWRVSTAVLPFGSFPTNPDWKELVQGRVDVIEIQDPQPVIQLVGRGEEAVLLDRWIDTERQYGSIGGIAMETVIQSMLDDNLGSGVVTLSTPVSPGYLMNVWTQPKGNLFPALVAVAEKAGYVLRYRYDSSNVYRLTLFKPNRTATTEDWSLGPSEYTGLPSVKADLSGVRNFIKIRFVDPTLGTQTVIYPHMAGTGTVSCVAGAATFSSSQAGVLQNGANIIVAGIAYTVSAFSGTTTCTLLSQLATGGVPAFGASAFTAHGTLSGAGTTASLLAFGRRDMEIDLSFTTQVNSGTKAQGMADAVGPDMEFPNLEQQVETPGFWFVQLWDYGRFLANSVHYDTDQFGGVTSINHQLAQGSIKTTLGVRGKPAGKYTSWRYIAGAQTTAPTQALLMRARIISQTATTTVIRVAVADPYPQSTNAATITYSELGTGAATSPASGQVVSMGTTITEAAGTYADFTVTRPTSSSDAARVTFTASAAGRASATDAVDIPMSHNGQGSIIPISMALLPISYNASGPATNRMSASFSWSAVTAYRPDLTTVSVPASASYPTPPSPTLSQVVSGALGGRTLFARIGYMKNNMIHRVGAEASFVVSANNVLKITSPPTVAGFDKWVPMVGSSASGEFIQIELPFGTDYQEISTGFNSTTTTPYNSNMDNAVTAQALPASTTVYWYPYYDISFGFIAFASRGNTAKSEVDANVQNSDGHISFSPGASSVGMPAGGGSASGTLTNSGGRLL